MNFLKLLAVVALFVALFVSCEAESLTEDQEKIEEIEIIFSTGNEVDEPEGASNQNGD